MNIFLKALSKTVSDIKCHTLKPSPLAYIRQQQVANVARTMCGVRAAAIGESEENEKEISEGKYNIVYGGAEQWLNNRWKKCLQYGGLHQSKVLVVDEVHTIETCEMCMI